MIMEQSTMKETITCNVAARNSSWSLGGSFGTFNSERARVETNIAPTPI